jgi:tetratricopeptide (TPR) repeat protein
MFAQIGSDQRPLRDLTVKEVLDASARKVEKRFESKPLAAAEVHASLGASYVAMDDAAAAERELDQALKLYEQHGFDDLPKVLEVVERLTYLKDALATLPAEIGRYEHILELGREKLGPADSAVLRLGQQLATARYSFGEWGQAATRLRRLLADARLAAVPDEKFLGSTEGALGRVLIQLGAFEEAEGQLRSSLNRLIAQTGPDHVQVAQSRTFLAEALGERGAHGAADTEINAALEVASKWAPNPAAAYLLRVRIAQGRLRMEQGRFDEATRILEDVLNLLLAQSGPERDQSGPVRRPLAEAYQRQGRLKESAEQMRLALASGERTQPRHPGTERIRIGLADIYREQGQAADARAQLGAVRMDVLETLPAQHPIRAQWLRVRGLLLAAESRTTEARAALAESLDICRKVHGQQHWRTERAVRELAVLPEAGV